MSLVLVAYCFLVLVERAWASGRLERVCAQVVGLELLHGRREVVAEAGLGLGSVEFWGVEGCLWDQLCFAGKIAVIGTG